MPPNSTPAPRSGPPPGRNHSRPLVIATGNAGKLREFAELLADLPYEVIAQSTLGLKPAAETGTSFVENALLKARHASVAAGMAAIADDSGLEVDALGGAPGVFSGRYAGLHADAAANNAKLCDALAAIPAAERTARYRCALVYVDAAEPDRAPLVAEAFWEGRIVSSPRGAAGFGYDAHFWLPELGKTVAELDLAQKNRLSHRGKAMRELQRLLRALEPA
jgi:XTP/dITP diphosphohydrolase